jgi:hypothetical protein
MQRLRFWWISLWDKHDPIAELPGAGWERLVTADARVIDVNKQTGEFVDRGAVPPTTYEGMPMVNSYTVGPWQYLPDVREGVCRVWLETGHRASQIWPKSKGLYRWRIWSPDGAETQVGGLTNTFINAKDLSSSVFRAAGMNILGEKVVGPLPDVEEIDDV